MKIYRAKKIQCKCKDWSTTGRAIETSCDSYREVQICVGSVCDLCGEESKAFDQNEGPQAAEFFNIWNEYENDFGGREDYAKCPIRYKSQQQDSENDRVMEETISADFCPVCFKQKILPALEKIGCKFLKTVEDVSSRDWRK